MSSQRQPRPCSPAEAVARALAVVEAEKRLTNPHRYGLGCGDYRAEHPDDPFTLHARTNTLRCDCSGFLAFCNRLRRKRDGFNVGSWSVVAGYINTDSKIQDAQHQRELFTFADRPQLGDVLCWPSIYTGELEADPKKRRRRGDRERIGHESLVVGVERVVEWDPKFPSFDLLDVAQCGSSHRPAIHVSTGAAWSGRDNFRGQRRPEWAAVLLRLIP